MNVVRLTRATRRKLNQRQRRFNALVAFLMERGVNDPAGRAALIIAHAYGEPHPHLPANDV